MPAVARAAGRVGKVSTVPRRSRANISVARPSYTRDTVASQFRGRAERATGSNLGGPAVSIFDSSSFRKFGKLHAARPFDDNGRAIGNALV